MSTPSVSSHIQHIIHHRTPRRALITGITGQDGSYLTEFLIAKGSSSFNTGRLDDVYQDPHVPKRSLVLHYGDLTDSTCLISIISKVKPQEIYNLGAQSHVAVSFQTPEYTAEVDGLGTLRLLDAVRSAFLDNEKAMPRVYQASTSELYGMVREIPQTEKTPFYPRSPYAVAKQFAFWACVNYREAYGMFVSNGILFNHESPRRGATFVTRKITRAVARMKEGPIDRCLYLGNINAMRDWGHANDYVEAMWLMMQHSEPDDFVVATGEQHSVREFCELAFGEIGIKIEWKGEGVDEIGINSESGEVLIRVDPRYFRPTEVETLLGDYSKAKSVLGWSPKTPFKELVRQMVANDVKLMEKGDIRS